MEFWETLEKLAGFFAVELRLTCDEPLKIFRRYPDFCHGEFTREERLEEAFARCLPEEQAREESVMAFVSGLGKTDLEGQLSHCGRYEHIFSLRYQEACREYRVKGKLHQKLWMLAGAAVSLLFL